MQPGVIALGLLAVAAAFLLSGHLNGWSLDRVASLGSALISLVSFLTRSYAPRPTRATLPDIVETFVDVSFRALRGVAILGFVASIGIWAVASGIPRLERLVEEMSDPAIRTTARLNLRAAPEPQSGILLTLEKGAELVVLGRSDGGTWIRVRDEGGREGWVHSGYVSGLAPFSAPESVSDPEPALLPEPEAGWVRIPDQMTLPGWEQTPVANLHLNCSPSAYQPRSLATQEAMDERLSNWLRPGNLLRAVAERLCRERGQEFDGQSRCRNERAEIHCSVENAPLAGRDCDRTWRAGAWANPDWMQTPPGFEVTGSVHPRAECYYPSKGDSYGGRGELSVRGHVATIVWPIRQAPIDPLLESCKPNPAGIPFVQGGAPQSVREIVVEVVDESCGDKITLRLPWDPERGGFGRIFANSGG